MNEKLRFAIIGCGKIASRHAAEIVKHGKLVAVCDIIKEKADALAKQFSSRAYYSIEELLQHEKKTEIMVICTPNGLHAAHARQCLQEGHHVLCEKPMAISSLDAKYILLQAEEAMKKIYVVKQNRYNPPVVFVKKLLQEHKLGKILSFQLNCFWNRPRAYYENSWHGTLEMDGGILFTQFSHFIDLLYWFLGDVESVKGVRHNYLHQDCIEFEDSGVAILQMKIGAIGSMHYHINCAEKNMEGSFTLFGEKGTVKIGGQYLNELEYFYLPGEPMPELPKSKAPNQYGYYEGSMSNHDKVYENLIKALSDPTHPFIEAEEAMKSVEIIEKIYKASPLLP
jgi:predicted dehydrogenase